LLRAPISAAGGGCGVVSAGRSCGPLDAARTKAGAFSQSQEHVRNWQSNSRGRADHFSLVWKQDQRDESRLEVTLGLASSDATRKLFDADFRLRFRVTIGPELEMELEAWNETQAPFTFEEALHTYLTVRDVQEASVLGLKDTMYIDKTDGFKRKLQGAEPLRISKETDQVHLNTRAACTVWDPVWNRRIIIEKGGSNSTVIWDPWSEKSKDMFDMEPDGWKQMICVETANAAENAILLAPGASHKMTARIRVEL
jgi:glucose-6-phosphate 1-epimerase